jgi:hypothetical protein
VYLPNGMAWEPITGDLYRTRDHFLAYADARVERVYTEAQAVQQVARRGHLGPWHKPLHRTNPPGTRQREREARP